MTTAVMAGVYERMVRPDVPEDCLGAEIDRLAAAERSLTAEQLEVVEADFDGRPQIIRGVAGSGKTWVLANHLARRVARHSQGLPGLSEQDRPRIGVVCFNRCLVPFIKRRAREAYDKLPHGARFNCSVTINHANGFLYGLSRRCGGPLTYLHVNEQDERDARRRAAAYLDQVGRLKRSGGLEPFLFDTIYLDEGQDLEEEEYRLLLELIRPDRRTGEKNLIVFYDDAQNLYGRPRPRWADLGLKVDFGLRSRVMKECHRNTQEVIEFAFNVLVGSRVAEGIRVTTRAFADTETLKRHGLITEDDSHVRVHFAKRSGPRPAVTQFEDREAERAWVAREVARLVDEEHVRPEDILILAEDRNGLGGLAGSVRACCRSGVAFSEPHLKGQKDEYILKPGRLTSTTTRSAKGYDGHVVFVVAADTFPLTTQGRASFYVGCSRARLRLYVTGVGGKGTLMDEARAVAEVLTAGR